MAMLPSSMRTSAAYLGGGIARGLEQQGKNLAQQGQNLIKFGENVVTNSAKKIPAGNVMYLGKDPIRGRVGQFLQNIGQPVESLGNSVQSFAANVGAKGGMTKRDLGLIAQAAGVGGAFVGGMGASQGMNALANFYAQDTLGRRSEVGAVGSSPMPQDLQTGYISLNQYGSPLGYMNVGSVGDMRNAQLNQRAIRNAGLAAAALGASGAGALAGGVLGTMAAKRGMGR